MQVKHLLVGSAYGSTPIAGVELGSDTGNHDEKPAFLRVRKHLDRVVDLLHLQNSAPKRTSGLEHLKDLLGNTAVLSEGTQQPATAELRGSIAQMLSTILKAVQKVRFCCSC